MVGDSGGRETDEMVGEKETCLAGMLFVVVDEVAERAELEEGGGGRATEGVDESAEEAVVEE